jgi:antitoxin MazE
MQIAKWGNSLAVRLPAGLVQELELKVGDEIAVRAVKEGDAQLILAVERKRSRKEIIEDLAALRWPAPKGFKFDREDANARGDKT